MARRFGVLAAMAVSLYGVAARAGAVSIDDWEIGTSVRVTGIGNQTVLHSTPQNNFAETFTATAGNSSALSSVTASWDNAGSLDFLVEGEHACQGGDGVTCRSSGTIYFSPQMNSAIDLSGTYNFSMGGGIRFARLIVVLAEVEPLMPLINSTQTRITLEGISVGQIVFDTDPVPLTGGVQYVVFYTLQLTSFGGSATNLSMGDGSFHMAVTPVPSPTTCAMLLTLAPLVLLRRRNRGGPA